VTQLLVMAGVVCTLPAAARGVVIVHTPSRAAAQVVAWVRW
jgi:hypothetical protein